MNAGTLSISNPFAIDVAEAVDQLMAEGQSHADRRAEQRHPFFAPVSGLSLDEASPHFSAFAREISHSGIGLLHNMELKRGVVLLTINGPGASRMTLTTDLLWCRPVGEGWFISGGRFVAAKQTTLAE